MKGKPLDDALKAIVGESRVLSRLIDRIGYSRDMSVHAAVPDVVVLPRSAEDVQKVMRFASEEGVPVTPRGAGTSVTGAIIPVKGGIVLDISGMNKIKEINITDHYAVVEPGVVCGNLNAELAPKFFFPPDPGSSTVATIGGMISTNASGLRAVKYGTTKDYVTALEVVLPTGELVRMGHKVPKASAGYDLTHLIVSAEGTLGVITEATLRIVPMPEKIAFCLANFDSIEQAGEAAADILTSGLPLCACEIMDRISLDVVSEKMGLDLEGVEAMLIMEVDGHPAAVADQVQRIREMSEKHGATHVHASISRIPDAIKRAQALSKKHGIIISTFGHVGDGNLHTTFILDPRDSEGWKKVESLAWELNGIALDYGGTLSAEHGIGIAKVPFIRQELGAAHDVMKRIKEALDPAGIMNPGKLGLDGEAITVTDYFAFGDLPEHPEKFGSLGSKLADEESLLCVMCGFCRAVCPPFLITGAESDNARGKVQLAWAMRISSLQWSLRGNSICAPSARTARRAARRQSKS
jgi:glycolate oxidase